MEDASKVRRAPHQPQKRAVGWHACPHSKQTTSSGDPQVVQNLLPGAFSLAQLAHRMQDSCMFGTK